MDQPADCIRTVERRNGAIVVEAAGEIDLRRSVAFQQRLLGLLDEKPQVLVIDLSDVGYMDSSGVATLVKVFSRANRTGTDLRLCGLSDRVRSLFEITRLDSVFSIYPDRQEALG